MLNGFFLLLPVIILRYGLLAFLGFDALKRASHFPPLKGREAAVLWVYQISNLLMLFYLIFLRVEYGFFFYLGLIVYMLGTVSYTASIIHFAQPGKDGINRRGLYSISRNPMYVSYFIYFLGCSMLTSSWFLMVLLLLFQVSVHRIVLSEEIWCKSKFGSSYLVYMNRVRRYI
jgi:protein-S-isoprenylcysteine O-methyltransferase Ste14